MLDSISTVLPRVIGWIGTILNEIISDGGDLVQLRELVTLGICFSLCLFVATLIKRFAWGA